jgi:hypothetical protein
MKKLKKAQKRFLKTLSLGALASIVIHAVLVATVVKNPQWFFPLASRAIDPMHDPIVETKVLTEKEFQDIQEKHLQFVETEFAKEQVENFKKTNLLSTFKNSVKKESRSPLWGSLHSVPMQMNSGQQAAAETEGRKKEKIKSGKESTGQKGTMLLTPNSSKIPHGTHDLLERDIAIGVGTVLNTDEFRYGHFFLRVREKFLPIWTSRITGVTSLSDNSLRKLPLKNAFTTMVRYRFNTQGIIEKITVIQESGIPEFDRVAVESFLEMNRVPNPPSEIFEGEKHHEITWELSVPVESDQGRVQVYVNGRRLGAGRTIN